MSNFISNYLNKLRASDEKTKHRSAMTIAIVASVIILSFGFLIFKDRLLNINSNKDNVATEEVNTKNEETELESPLTSFMNFFKETGNQFSSMKSAISGVFNNSTTSTNTNNINEERDTEIENHENTQNIAENINSTTSSSSETLNTGQE